MLNTKSIVAVDIGNSRIKLLYNNLFKGFEIQSQWENMLLNYLDKLSTDQTLLYYSSVNPKIEIEFLELCTSKDNLVVNSISNLLRKQNFIDTSSIQGIGNDRLLGLIGALRYSDFPIITLDFGSAITINFANDGKCIGGAILPGAITQINSLAKMSESLKVNDFNISGAFYGNNTSDAIMSGIYLSCAGAVEKALEKAESQFGSEFTKNIYATGGLAHLFADKIEIKQKINYKPNLVLEGIYKLITTSEKQ